MNGLEIIDILEKSDRLPVMSGEITNIINMISDYDTINIEDLAEKIGSCGNLSESLLSNVNSGYFRLARKIESLSDAIVYLGMETVERLIIAYLIKYLIPNDMGRSKELNREKYWKHCLGTSISATLLAEKIGKKDKYKYFAYGLIHDLGVALLDICVPHIVDEVVIAQQKGIHQIIAERLVMKGATHEQFGQWQCERWGLPEDIKEIVSHHHTPLMAKNYKEEVYILCIADSISSLYYERLLCLNTKYVLNKSVMKQMGITEEDIEEITKVLPMKVEEANKQLNFNLFQQ